MTPQRRPEPRPRADPRRSSRPTATAAVRAGRRLGGPLPACDVAGRLGRLQAGLGRLPRGSALDALLVTDLVNIRYLTGFTGSSARVLVPVQGTPVLLTDGRYEERAHEELRAAGCPASVSVRTTQKAQDEVLRAGLAGAGRLGLEADAVSWNGARAYEALLPRVEVVPTSGVVERLRRRKDGGEIARLARASAIADAALATVVPLLAEGPTEAAFRDALESAMARLGSDGPSFPTIIAAGPNGSRPHHATATRRVQRGDAVIVDFGATIDGYHSDMTRTVFVGAPGRAQRRHFGVVREAQAAGVAAVRGGAACAAVDAACREVIAAARWGRRFVHGTGHGIGLRIHEEPWVSGTSAASLAPGDTVTVEPGVYLPGRGGVRIEDSLVVTPTGNVVLTHAPYDLIID